MPVHNRFFLERNGSLNPNILVSTGPVLSVEVSIPKELADLLASDKKAIPSPKAGYALIDTGATRSGVDQGRDILSRFIFIYNGPGGFFSIAL